MAGRCLTLVLLSATSKQGKLNMGVKCLTGAFHHLHFAVRGFPWPEKRKG